MSTILLQTREEYNYVVSKGYNPLIDIKHFALDIKLRVSLQSEIFGKCVEGRGNIVQANNRFYRYVWDNYSHFCQECLRPLDNYSAAYCSHILSRGAHPKIAHDPRNINILCYHHHTQYETGDRRNMRVYQQNKKIIKLLLSEYNTL